MSIEIMAQVWERAPVQQGMLLVLLAIADSADAGTRQAYPGIPKLAAKSRLSERQVKACVAGLVDLDILGVQRNASPVKTNLYTVRPASDWRAMCENCTSPDGPDVQSEAPRCEAHFPSDVQPTSPKPSVTSDLETPEGRSLFSEHEEATLGGKGRIPEKQKKESAPDHFAAFWAAWPAGKRKTDRPKVAALFASIVAGRHKSIPKTDPELLIAGARAFAASERDPAYDPMPSTWLNGARWEQYAGQASAPASDLKATVRGMLGRYIGERRAGARVLSSEALRARDMAQQICSQEGWDIRELAAQVTA